MEAIAANPIVESVLSQLEAKNIEADFAPHQQQEDTSGCLLLSNGAMSFHVDIKQTLRLHQLPALVAKQKKYAPYFIVLSASLPPNIQTRLKAENINYIDGEGNTSIVLEKPFVNISHIATKSKKVATLKAEKLSAKMSIALLYFLEHKTELNSTIRSIAEVTQLSNDTIQKTKDWLKQKKYILLSTKTEYVWINWKDTYERWLIAYEENLRPKAIAKNYRWTDTKTKQEWQNALIAYTSAQYSSEAGLRCICDWLEPKHFDIYSNETQLWKKLKLLPDNEGDVTLYNRFWSWKNTSNHVSNLIIYADLLLHDDARVRSLATRFENEYIKLNY